MNKPEFIKRLGIYIIVLLVTAGFIAWLPLKTVVTIQSPEPGAKVNLSWTTTDSSLTREGVHLPLTLELPADRVRVSVISLDSAKVDLRVELRSVTRVRATAETSGRGELVVTSVPVKVAACAGRNASVDCSSI